MPVSRKQLEILAFPYTDYECLICDGSIRSGKTSFMSIAFVDWMMENFDRKEFILLGKTVGSARRNVIAPLTNVAVMRERYGFRWRQTESALEVTSGRRTNLWRVFGAKDTSSYQLIQGMTAAGMLCDEVALCDRQAVEQAVARCSVPGSRLWFNCNPESPEHWFRREWILQPEKHNALHIHLTMDDNPALDEKIKQRYVNTYEGVFKKRYIDGEWVMAEGLVYRFTPEDCEEFAPYDDEVCYVSIDYGITNPFAALMWCVRDGVAHCFDEWGHDSKQEGYRLTDSELYDGLQAWIGNRNVAEIVIDPSASSFIEEIDRHGRFYAQKANNDVINGIQRTQRGLQSGSVKIGVRCAETRKEFGLYLWDEKASKRGEDAVVKQNDHYMDSMRYFVNTVGRDIVPELSD